ncbi:MAG: C4-dicarboxylate ABC transporter [Alphaproteobacteria bacterium]|nr:C4-dicarboxylate ABC transporter [Alphaproteobacteria bacterium]
MSTENRGSRLEHFPVSFFAIVMGLSGLTIGWIRFQHLLGVEFGILSVALTTLSTVTFFVLFILYAAKLVRYPGAVIHEIHHPVKINFFPAISVSLLLLSIVYLSLSTTVSLYLWVAGACLHFGFTLYVVNVWMHHKNCQIQHMNPAWLIPAVGNVIVPIAGVQHGFIEISWMFFSIGMLFWMILMTVIMYRILFHNPIDERLMPTLFILIAPPSVGFISYVGLNGEVDNLARFFLYAGLFLTILLATKIRRFIRLKFFMSWWAYSFPLAAISIANMLMFAKTGINGYFWIGSGLLFVLSGIVLMLAFKTVEAILDRRICLPEG